MACPQSPKGGEVSLHDDYVGVYLITSVMLLESKDNSDAFTFSLLVTYTIHISSFLQGQRGRSGENVST